MIFNQAALNTGIGNTSATLSSTVTVGDHIVVFADSGFAVGTITSVDDNHGNSYTPMVASFTQFATSQQHIIQVWTATASGTVGSLTVTAHTSTGAFITLVALDYSSNTIFTYDQYAVANNASNTAQSVGPTGSTSSASELLLCYIITGTGGAPSFTQGTGYTKRGSVSSDPNFGLSYAIEDQIVSSIAAYSATWTLGTAKDCALVLVSFALSAATTAKPVIIILT